MIAIPVEPPASGGVRRSARRQLLLLWVAWLILLAGVVLGLAEVGLRVRREWIAAHLAVPPSTDHRLIADRLLRYKNKPSYRYASESGAAAELFYTNNSLGLRGAEISRTKPGGTRRVVIVGGSTVYGALVDDSETISVHLERLLAERLDDQVAVINGGTPGYEGLREMVFARSELFALQPDVVVDLDGLNDVFYGSLEEWPSQVAADQLGILSDGRLPDVVAMIDATMFPHGLIEHQVTMLGRTVRPRTYAALHQPAPVPPRIVNERVVALHASSMALLARDGRQSGIRVVAALQPLLATGQKKLSEAEIRSVEYQGYWSVGNWPEIALSTYPRLAESTQAAMRAEGGLFVDLTGAFDREPGTTYAEDAVHYTSLGDRRLAEALAPIVERLLRADPVSR